MGHIQFDIVDMLHCEWEEGMADGLDHHRMPYAHLICFILAQCIGFPQHMETLQTKPLRVLQMQLAEELA